MRRFASQEGQEALRRVLLAYAAYDPEVGKQATVVALARQLYCSVQSRQTSRDLSTQTAVA